MATLILIEKCSVCKKEAHKKCGNCKMTWYCSKECQQKDWKEHKNRCRVYEKLLHGVKLRKSKSELDMFDPLFVELLDVFHSCSKNVMTVCTIIHIGENYYPARVAFQYDEKHIAPYVQNTVKQGDSPFMFALYPDIQLKESKEPIKSRYLQDEKGQKIVKDLYNKFGEKSVTTSILFSNVEENPLKHIYVFTFVRENDAEILKQIESFKSHII